MRKVCIVLFLLCFFSAENTFAETFAIGKQHFSYTVPPGYIQLQRGRNEFEDMQINYLESASGFADAVLVAVMAEQETTYGSLKEGHPMREWVTLLYSRGMTDMQLSPEILDTVKETMLENPAQRFLKQKQSEIKDIARRHLDTEVEFAVPLKPEVVSQSKTALSLLASIVVTEEGETSDVLALTTVLHQSGKLVFVNHYMSYMQPGDIDLLKKKAVVFLAGLDIRPEGGEPAPGVVPESDPGFSKENSGKVMYAMAAGAPLLFVLLLLWMRRNKRTPNA